MRSLAICIGCGCDDLNACYDEEKGSACHWERLDRAAGLGLCSTCRHLVEAWDTGDRQIRGLVEPESRS